MTKYIFFTWAIFLTACLFEGNAAHAQDKTADILQRSFIWTTTHAGTGDLHAVFRKEFETKKGLQKGMLNLFAYNRFVLYINGFYVMRGPVRFENKKPQYASIAIDKYLKSGKNVIVVIVHRNNHTGRIMNHQPGFTALLNLTDNNGVSTSFKTDKTWKATPELSYLPTPAVWASIPDNIDARKMPANYTDPAFDAAAWARAIKINTDGWAALSRQELPFQEETEVEGLTVNGKSISTGINTVLTTNDSVSVKLPRFTQAYIQLIFDADENSEFALINKSCSLYNTYICRNGSQKYVTGDTFGLKQFDIKVKYGHIRIKSIKVIQRIYPFKLLGSFFSNDTLLNRIWNICTYSLRILSEDAYVDCADRERVEWMDCDPPAFDVTRISMAGPDKNGKKMYADSRLLKEMLRRTALTQQPDGRVKAHTCSDRWDIHGYMEDRACDWVEGVRRYYESTGDSALIRELWKPIILQLKWFLAHRTVRGLVNAREWVVWGNPMGYQNCEGAGLNEFVFKALIDAAYLGNIIGEKKQAKELNMEASQLKNAFNTYLWDKEKGAYYAGHFENDSVGKQSLLARKSNLTIQNGNVEPTFHAALFAIDQGIVPQQRQDSVNHFIQNNKDGNYEIMTYYYLFTQLYARRDSSSATEVLNMIRKKWKDMADDDMQMTWEGFDKRGNKAHIYGMFPAWFLSAYTLGVRLDGPVSNRRLIIKPQLGDLKEAKGTVLTELGLVPVSWKKEKSKLIFSLDVPKRSSAVLLLEAKATSTLTLNNNKSNMIIKNNVGYITLKPGLYKGIILQ